MLANGTIYKIISRAISMIVFARRAIVSISTVYLIQRVKNWNTTHQSIFCHFFPLFSLPFNCSKKLSPSSNLSLPKIQKLSHTIAETAWLKPNKYWHYWVAYGCTDKCYGYTLVSGNNNFPSNVVITNYGKPAQ